MNNIIIKEGGEGKKRTESLREPKGKKRGGENQRERARKRRQREKREGPPGIQITRYRNYTRMVKRAAP